MSISDPGSDILSVVVFDEEPGGKDTPVFCIGNSSNKFSWED
jgi:hypothetical protein